MRSRASAVLSRCPGLAGRGHAGSHEQAPDGTLQTGHAFPPIEGEASWQRNGRRQAPQWRRHAKPERELTRGRAGLLDAASDAAGDTVLLAAEGAADVTRGEDELQASEALGDLSDIAEAKGVRDVAAGAITLDAAEDAAAVGALMAAVTADDLDRGMLLASLSGQLRVASDVVDLMHMPVLSGFLGVKGRQLRGLAVNEIGSAMAAAALAQGMDAMADRLAALGLGEVAAGLQELETADVLLDARDAAHPDWWDELEERDMISDLADGLADLAIDGSPIPGTS